MDVSMETKEDFGGYTVKLLFEVQVRNSVAVVFEAV